MNRTFTILVLSLIFLAACKSPEEKMEAQLQDINTMFSKQNFDDIPQSDTQLDSLFAKYVLLKHQIKNKKQLVFDETYQLSEVKISGDTAMAMVNWKEKAMFIKKDKRWILSCYPAMEARITAVSFLYAMDIGYYDLARQLSTTASHEMIDLSQQFDKLSGNTELRDSTEMDIKILQTQIEEQKAVVKYTDSEEEESIMLLKKGNTWLVNLQNEAVGRDSIPD